MRVRCEFRKHQPRTVVSLASLWVVMGALLLLSVESGVAAEIARVEVEGNRLIEEGTIVLQLSSKPGTPFSQQKIDEDIKQIYRTGFFDQVGARTVAEGRAGDKISVVFVVAEKPAIRNVFLQGNEEVNDETLKGKLNISARRFLDRQKINAGIKEAKSYYQSIGYYDTVITSEEKLVGENQVDITFQVVEGTKKVVRELVFEGNRAFTADELEDVVKIAPHSWWISWLTGRGILKKEYLENDSKELARFYMNRGYAEIRVAEPKIEPVAEGLRLTFVVDEGEKYSYGDLSASGSLVEGSIEKTLEGIKSKKGETFSADTLREDTFTVAEKFTDVGYAFANVNPLTRLNREKKTLDVEFSVDQGQKVTVNRINISGNSKTYDNVIRRSLDIEEQSLFSSSKVKKSQEYLQRLGYFDEVSIAPEVTDRDDEIDLGVAVKEAQTGSFSIGGGVSSGDGFLFSAQISERNLFGTGNALTLNADNGSRRRTYLLSFQNPRVNDSRWSFNTEAQATTREYSTFDRSQQSVGFGGGYPLWFLGPEYLEDVRFFSDYELARIEIDNLKEKAPKLVKDQEGVTTISSVTPKIVRNTIDNPLEPRKGSRQVTSVELAGLGGEEKFWLGQASNTLYFPLWNSPVGTFVFSQRTRVGYGDTFDDEPFPVVRRFFPGGINSVRGYKARKLGPKDENNEVYGGNKELVANFEMIFPLFQSIGLNGLFFYDAGNAFDDDESIRVPKLRQAIGYGLRWRSPLAPIRIEIGYPLDKEEGDSSYVTNFTFGTPQ